VNFLFPFSDKPRALTELLRPLFPTIHHVLPMEGSSRFLSFEWIGLENYLGEYLGRTGTRTRGAYCTSADAAVMFEHMNGFRQIVLIEWKYTETNNDMPLRFSDRGTDRMAIYAPLYERPDCPLNKELLPDFEALFFAPFYQLMRQQFLA
jgi:hypothetical protein